MEISRADEGRFWLKVDRKSPDECWLWLDKSKHWKGYGLFTIATGKPGGRKLVASRVACFLQHGAPTFEKAKALHSCDNPPCCNPAHLRWGTQRDNVADAKERKRHVNPPDTHSHPEWNSKRLAAMPKGEKLHNQSLTEHQAREIFRLHMSHHNVTQISEQLGIKKHVVADVCRGRSWQHLPDAPSTDELKKGGVRRGFNQFSQSGNPLSECRR